MKNLLFAAFVLLLLIVGLTFPNACYYDNEEEQYGVTSCDTVQMRYSTDIKPIIDNNCISCHSPSGTEPEKPMNTYDGLKAYASDGNLVLRTNDNSSPMPPTGLLKDCDREKIRAWVLAGAPNN